MKKVRGVMGLRNVKQMLSLKPDGVLRPAVRIVEAEKKTTISRPQVISPS